MTATLNSLLDDVSGDVVLPGDRAYERLSRSFVHPGRPALVVRCADVADVRTAIRFARDNSLVVSVRSGGHSAAGFSTNEGGIVIDVSSLNGIEVLDPRRRLARLGTGATWGDAARALSAHGLSFSSGDTTTVGVGGLLLGGGIGWMARKYGLAVDNVVAAEVVTADGDLLRASAEENPELFWGLRGGSGNFGVATSFDVVAQPVTDVSFGTIAYPAADTAAVLKGWAACMRSAPEELTCAAAIFPAFGEEPPPLTLSVCYAGGDAGAAEAAIGPLLGLGDVVDRQIRTMPYPEVLEDPSELPPTWVPRVRSSFAPVVTDELVDAAVTHARSLDTMYVEFRSLGGAVRRVPTEATAFAHRDVEALVTAVLLGSPEETYRTPAAAGYEAFWAAAAPHTTGAYSGFLSRVDADDIAAVFPPETYARLVELKRRYDPENVFDQNPNVRP